MKNLFLCLTIILLISGQACKSGGPKKDSVESSKSGLKFTSPEIASVEKAKEANTTERKLTKEASISFETRAYRTTCLAIQKLIAKYSGQIIRESDNIRDNKELEGNFDIRIPAKSFDSFLHELESVDGKIVNKEINIDDITADYIDVETRLKSKKELEARYIQLLAKATKVSDMLEIEEKLNDQRTEIESIEGRFKFMQHEVANNLLHIKVLETKATTSGFIGKILYALSNGWSVFVQFLIVLLTLWPFWIVGGGIWFLIHRYRQREKKKINSLRGIS